MYWPFWLAYSVGTLERSGHDVLFYDCPAENITKDQLLEKLKAASPAMIVLDTSTPSIHSDLSISSVIAEAMSREGANLAFTYQVDKLKKQRFEISMKIIQIEDKQERSKLSKNEEKELKILKTKEEELDTKIESFS